MGCGGPRFSIPIPYPYPAPPNPVPERRESAKDILKMRLAQGEISIEEYEDMLRVLEGNAAFRPQTQKSHIRMP
ncbi:SHOCT domain-containing protein [Alicyclobacillus mengziensis]|uniref:SHOCT domain-containing protein n=1 Tax=Alicyclobacillus mengziensis TaxID=2931921 RepID=A0A9X7W3M6_9BACL|nr:hypothetical protein [Alicyclobacillus mengziensis]QSO48713.1 hypothetical protein JZ786_07055 [Alicyclobacillus mengziensis]